MINVTYTHTSPSQAMKTRQHLQKKHDSSGMKKISDILWRNITNQAELCSQTLIKETPTPLSTNPTKPHTDVNPYGTDCRFEVLFMWKTCQYETTLSAAMKQPYLQLSAKPHLREYVLPTRVVFVFVRTSTFSMPFHTF